MFGIGENMFEFITAMCVVSAGIPAMAYVITQFCQWVYAWLDDEEIGDNIFTEFLRNYIEYGWDSSDKYAVATITSFFMPIVIYLVITFWYVALMIAGFVALAHLARMCFRHRKLFNKHVDDESIHVESPDGKD